MNNFYFLLRNNYHHFFEFMAKITVTGPVKVAKHELKCFSNLLWWTRKENAKKSKICYTEQNIDPNCSVSEGDLFEQIVLRCVNHHGGVGNLQDNLRNCLSSDDSDSESFEHESEYHSEDSESETVISHHSETESDSESETESEKWVC